MLKFDLIPLAVKSLLTTKLLRVVACLVVAGVFSSFANAQANGSTIDVHTKKSKKFVSRISASVETTLIESQDSWDIVRFSEPVVPVWVSDRYIIRGGSSITVKVNNLNARLQPSLESAVVNQVANGYSSRVLGQRNGFVQILAPHDWSFAVKTSDRNLQPQQAANLIDESTAEVAAVTGETIPGKVTEIPSGQSGETSSGQVNEETPAGQIESTTAAPAPGSAELHKIAPGDTISLLVFGEQDLSASRVRVPSSGSVSFPLIGSTPVAGKTTSQIEDVVAGKLAGGYIRNPKLSVTIDSYRPIFIRGAVQQTGAFPYTEGLTVAKALALAGGIKNSAKPDSISILRDGSAVRSDLSVDSQYQISSGDIITVEEEVGVSEQSNFYVYLHGEVKKPGEYLYRRGLTVEKAVVLAGGFTLRASKRKISVSRVVEGQDEPQKLRKVELYLPVQPGDIINVGASWF